MKTEWAPTVSSCDDYLGERSGRYEYRAIRYRKSIETMLHHGLTDEMTVFDIGCGWTEFDYCLRKEYDWKGRYIPIDGGIDGTDINFWQPKRSAHWFVALELLEHLKRPWLCLDTWKHFSTQGVIISTPNPRTTDVLGMDATHIVEIHQADLEKAGMQVTEEYFYGGVYSDGEPDSLFGVCTK